MAFYKEDIVDINLNTGNIFRSFLGHSIGYKDDDADRFGIRAFRDGVPVDLSGASCQAIFMNPNGTNIALTSYGTVSGNVAYVTLPPACYDYEGQFCLAIKLVGGGVTGTVRIVDGTVTRTGASGAVAPTASVPTYQEILSTYDAMVAATSAANLAIAETFDATKAYPAGKYVINDGHLYRLTADHAANVTWTNTSKVATNFGDDLSSLKSALEELDDEYSGSKPFVVSSNLLDVSHTSAKGTYWVNGHEYSDTGTSSAQSTMVSVKMPCEAETTYYNALYNISDNARVINSDVSYLNYFKKDGTYISYEIESLEQVNGIYQGKFTTPANAEYIIISYYAYASGTDTEKSYNALVQKSPVPDSYVAYEVYNLHSAKNQIENLENTTKENVGYKKVVSGTSSYQENGGVFNQNGKWEAGPTSTSYMHIVIPCDADITMFSITPATGYYFFITAVTDYVRHSESGDTIQNRTAYWTKMVYVAAGTTIQGIVPKDAKYLLVPSKSSNNNVIDSLTITSIYLPKMIMHHPNRISMSAFNVRDFGDGTTEGCPENLVAEQLPLWKSLISKWLNTDFINITEWRTKFDANNTIDTYNTLFKQFFPYKYEILYDNTPIQCLMSKHECIFTDLNLYVNVRRTIPMLVTIIEGKTVAIVGWLQAADDTVEHREQSYIEAATALSSFDISILGGDFNTEVGLEELDELTSRGYTLGNGGYWGTINTWPSHNPATPNDNIASKGLILDLFEVGDDYITSDHLPVRAKLSM